MKSLKYLFAVEYTDGEIYHQTPEDKSRLDPEKRSEYYDVLQEVEKGKVIRRFSLIGDGNTVTVDLGTGIFYLNGIAIILESEKLPCLPEAFELIYYHQVSVSTNVTYDTDTDKELSREDLPEFREYFIGWQCTINGKNYKQKLGVA